MRAEAPLGQLQGALEGGGGADLEQLDHAALVGGEAHDLADDLADQGVAHALAALAVGGLLRQLALGHDVALVQARGHAGGLRLGSQALGLHLLAHVVSSSCQADPLRSVWVCKLALCQLEPKWQRRVDDS